MWQIKKISDEAYFAAGDILSGFDTVSRHRDLIVSNSFLKQIFKSNLFHYLTTKDEISDELQKIFDVGSAFHCYILEREHFDERYYFSEVEDISSDKIRIGRSDEIFIDDSMHDIKAKYPEIADGKNVELALFGVIDGVPVKCKIDKLNITKENGIYKKVEIIDLKSAYFDPFKFKRSPDGMRYGLRKQLSEYGYDLQFYFYKRLVGSWLESINQHCDVTFSLVVASKETHQVQKFTLGSEMHESGHMKFEAVWNDVINFYFDGKLNKEEML